MNNNEYMKLIRVRLDGRRAIPVIVDESAHEIRLGLIAGKKQEIYITRNGEVVAIGIVLEQQVRVVASVVEQLTYQVHLETLIIEINEHRGIHPARGGRIGRARFTVNIVNRNIAQIYGETH